MRNISKWLLALVGLVIVIVILGSMYDQTFSKPIMASDPEVKVSGNKVSIPPWKTAWIVTDEDEIVSISYEISRDIHIRGNDWVRNVRGCEVSICKFKVVDLKIDFDASGENLELKIPEGYQVLR